MIYHFKKQVATAGVAVPLSSVSIRCARVTLFPATVSGGTNTGQVRIGGGVIDLSTGLSTFPPTSIPAGLGMAIDKNNTAGYVLGNTQAVNALDLNSIYLDASTSADGVQGIYEVV